MISGIRYRRTVLVRRNVDSGGRWRQVAVCVLVLIVVVLFHVLIAIVSGHPHRVQFGPVATPQ